MKGYVKRILSFCLAAVIAVTTVGYAPPSFVLNAMVTKSRMEEAMRALASPSEAEEMVTEVATPSEAENPGEKATPSEAVKKFVQVEPEEIPEYYSQVKKVGKRFWKFEDRNGMMQYRDYGYMQGETEFPLWYEADGQGNVSEDINEEDEYYELSPYLYKSAAPTKASWSDLSWKLLNDSESIFLLDRKESGSFKNWDHSTYAIWSVNEKEGDEFQNTDLGYFFYGQILNESDSVEQWYYADVNGYIWPMKQFKTMMLMAEAPTTCKLKFDANGGIIYSDSTYEKELTINTAVTYSDMNAIKSNVKRAGYTFDGWNYEPDGSGTNFYDSTKVASDTTIYAKWRKNQYTVMFYRNYPVGDTTTYKYKSVYYGDPIGTFMDAFPVGKGMEFKGWYLNKYCSGDPVTPEMLMSDSTLNLYGKWENFDVTYKMHYGYGIDESTLPAEIKAKSTVVGQDLAKYYFPDLLNSSKLYAPGYADGYWTDDADYKTTSHKVISAEVTSSWFPTEHVTDIYLVKAIKWIAFDLYYPSAAYPNQKYGPSSWPIANAPYTKYGEIMSAKDLTQIMSCVPSGKKFAGLFYDYDQTKQIDLSRPIYPPDKQDKKNLVRLNVYLGVANESSKITFLDWDDKILNEQVVRYGEPIVYPQNPIRENYTFTGWDKELGSVSSLLGDIEVKAKYKINSNQLTLDGNGGTLSGESTIEKSINSGKSIDSELTAAKDSATRKFYTLDGWYTTPSGGSKYPESGNTMPDTDLTIYAQWIRSSSEVIFKDWDGKILDTQEVTIGADALPPTPPERDIYEFTGWDKSSINIQANTIITAQYSINDAYHAEWKANPYKIRFVYTEADGKQKIVEIDRNYFMQLGTLPAPEKPGYTFAGWFNETGEKITSESWVEAGNVEYKAKWIANQYTIHFDRNLPESGIIENPEDKTVTYGFLIGELPILQETVYLFLGWYTEPAGGKRIKETTFAALGDQTYYAHWVTGWIDNGNGTYSKPGNDGKWNTEDDEIWWKGPDGIAGTDDDKLIHTLPGGGFYVDNGNGTHIRPGNGESWKPGETEHWWNGPGGIPGGTDNKIIHTLPGGGSYVDNGDGTYIKPGPDGSLINGPEHWSSGPDGEIGTSDDKKIDSGNVDPEPTNPEPNPEPINPGPTKPESEERGEEEIINAPVILVIDSTVKPEVPDTGGTFTVNPNNPLEVTYTKPDGTVAKNEWIGDGKDWYHVNETGNLNYDWYLEGDKTWYKLNKEPGDRFGAALIGWDYEPMDDKRYFFDPSTTKMLTGWQFIDSKWYYFTKQNESQTYYGSNPDGWKYDPLKPGKPYGSMYQDEFTPDGYLVDENGVWKNK